MNEEVEPELLLPEIPDFGEELRAVEQVADPDTPPSHSEDTLDLDISSEFELFLGAKLNDHSLDDLLDQSLTESLDTEIRTKLERVIDQRPDVSSLEPLTLAAGEEDTSALFTTPADPTEVLNTLDTSSTDLVTSDISSCGILGPDRDDDAGTPMFSIAGIKTAASPVPSPDKEFTGASEDTNPLIDVEENFPIISVQNNQILSSQSNQLVNSHNIVASSPTVNNQFSLVSSQPANLPCPSSTATLVSTFSHSTHQNYPLLDIKSSSSSLLDIKPSFSSPPLQDIKYSSSSLLDSKSTPSFLEMKPSPSLLDIKARLEQASYLRGRDTSSGPGLKLTEPTPCLGTKEATAGRTASRTGKRGRKTKPSANKRQNKGGSMEAGLDRHILEKVNFTVCRE